LQNKSAINAWKNPSATINHSAEAGALYEGKGWLLSSCVRIVVIIATLMAPPPCWAELKMAAATPTFEGATEVMIPTLLASAIELAGAAYLVV
jgi:hypothetical protein